MKLHSMSEFGVVPELANFIRVNPLKLRLIPSVPFPHKHDFYQILWIASGGGWHEIDFKKHLIAAGSLFVMKPAQVHSWKFSNNVKGILVELNSFPNGADLPDFIKLNSKQFRRINDLFDGMLFDFEAKKQNYEHALTYALSLVCVLLTQEAPKTRHKDSMEDSFFNRFHSLIEENFKKKHDIQFYANALKISTKVLTMRIKRISDLSPRDHLHERLALEAKRLLAYSRFTVSEIGYALGFEDPNYFTRFFKKMSGFTPIEFKHKL